MNEVQAAIDAPVQIDVVAAAGVRRRCARKSCTARASRSGCI